MCCWCRLAAVSVCCLLSRRNFKNVHLSIPARTGPLVTNNGRSSFVTVRKYYFSSHQLKVDTVVTSTSVYNLVSLHGHHFHHHARPPRRCHPTGRAAYRHRHGQEKDTQAGPRPATRSAQHSPLHCCRRSRHRHQEERCLGRVQQRQGTWLFPLLHSFHAHFFASICHIPATLLLPR